MMTFRSWAVACAAAAFVLGAALFWTMKGDLVVCRSELAQLPEPEGWREWPILPDLGGYTIASENAAHCGGGRPCGMKETELRNASLCPRGGVSLDGWFDGSPYQMASDIMLRESNGTFVAAGHSATSFAGRSVSSKDETFIVAFRPRTGPPRLVFKNLPVAFACLVLAGALLRLLAGGFKARRLTRRAAEYRDAARYKAGERDESGTITFTDGSPPLTAAGPRGPVLVRVTAVTSGSYRVAQKTSAAEIVEGDVMMLSKELSERSSSELRRAWTIAVATGLLLFVVASVASVLENFRLE